MEPDKDFNLTVGLRIREIRETYHMTQAEFSERCNLSESFLAAVESGRKGITSKTLYKICTTMNVSADYFIRGRNKGFEADSLMEIINSMDKRSREGALRILREYADVVHQFEETKKI
ncbi:MAG: helix-turn-helix domain-containing protein [Clostridium sp.]|nr:helix-turn-helix domain-containing protein [Acetatifactor muris]MCM1527646.1 helix-turn-helix domain-containing protein [Bacteroides sp.]MCM1563662.1 helix-turn-helix domain-containing protein [Clostridium sp.]